MSQPRPYWTVSICDNQELLVKIPIQDFAAAQIHDYQKLGAPYQGASPYAVREGVLDALYQAQQNLQEHCKPWRLYIFDAYRPLSVQAFMAQHAYHVLVTERQLNATSLSPAEQQALWQEVYTIWAPPNDNPLTPPPHSTGAAVDLTIFDEQTQSCINMGSPIDELSERSHPHYFAAQVEQGQLKPQDLAYAKQAHGHRVVLAEVMENAGFKRHPGEWWHFCLGDQMWVWLSQSKAPNLQNARYGRYDLLKGMA